MNATDKTKISRLAKRGDYTEETIYNILDEGLICTLSYAQNNQPFSIPTGYCRIGNYLYIHGSVGSGYMRQMAEGIPVCISVTHIDALVLAKSVFHHSVNYRSVIAFANAELVTDETERMDALEAFTEKMIPGRWKESRLPNAGEMRQTMILKFKLNEASAKLRQAPPSDDEEDLDLPYWSGLLHIKQQVVAATPDDITTEKRLPYPGYYGV